MNTQVKMFIVNSHCISDLFKFSNIQPKPVYATEFTGTKLECGVPSYSPSMFGKSV